MYFLMVKKEALIRFFFYSILLLLSLFFIMLFIYNRRAEKYNSISIKANNVLDSWIKLEGIKNDFLLNRSSIGTTGQFNFKNKIAEWESVTANFTSDFDDLAGNITIRVRMRELQDLLNEALVLWQTTSLRLSEVQKNLTELEKSALIDALFPQLLLNFYLKRNTHLLSFRDTITIMNLINQFAMFDVASKEFYRIIYRINLTLQQNAKAAAVRLKFLTCFFSVLLIVTWFLALRFLFLLRKWEHELSSVRKSHDIELIRRYLLGYVDLTMEQVYVLFQESALPKGALTIPILLNLNNMKDISRRFERAHIEKMLMQIKSDLENKLEKLQVRTFIVPAENSLVIFHVLLGDLLAESPKQRILKIAEKIGLQTLGEEKGINFSTVIGRIHRFPEEVVDAYAELMEFSKYRLIYGYDKIIDAEQIPSNVNTENNYPLHKENELCTFLKQGKTTKAREVYLEIIDLLSKGSINFLKNGLMRLVMTITTVLDTVERMNNLSQHIDILGFTTMLDNMETIEEINRGILELIDQVAFELSEKKDQYMLSHIAKVNEIIKKEFSNPNLSIGSIAQKLNLSSNYLGRMYKTHVGASIQEMTTQRRMEEAKKLLESDNLIISEIAETVGIMNSAYFYILFKNTYGVTPNEYRTNRKYQSESDHKSSISTKL